MKRMRTQVAIVGAGPAGLMLSHLLHGRGIESVVLEDRSRAYVEQRVRAGVLEQTTVDLLRASGLAQRMEREGLVHHGLALRFGGRSHRVDLTELTGRAITVYGQQELVKDLIAARLAAGGEVRFEVADVKLHDLESTRPRVSYREGDADCELACDFVAGCDGFHGVSRGYVEAAGHQLFERAYPFAWLGILARARPASHELVYACHERGFALLSMRSPEISRLYLQVAQDEPLADWPDARIWEELHRRLDTPDLVLEEGPILERGVTGMRSFVIEPMQRGRLFLAGDAAHIVPPTGAKGMNLAIADVYVLSRALASYYESRDEQALASYSSTCLERVWRAEHFSWWMTTTLHRAPGDDPFQHKLQLAQLAYLTRSRAAATSFAENYAGLPFA